MKKLFIALSFIFLMISGCEKDYDDVINPSIKEYYVEWAGVNDQDTIDIISGDSILFLRIKVYPQESINSVNAEIKNSFGNIIAALKLFDNGDSENLDLSANDSVYSNKLILYKENPPGNYSIRYSINGEQAASQFFYFETEKFPPVISNLIMPDSAAFNDSIEFSVFAVDSNGTGDISLVYYELFRPDGSQVVNSQGISKFPMYDNGDPEIGDITAGDNIYSYKLLFPPGIPTVPPGTWRFEFSAADRSNRLSNKIIHFLEVH